MPSDTRPVNDRAQVTRRVGGEEREHWIRRTPAGKTPPSGRLLASRPLELAIYRQSDAWFSAPAA